MNTITDNTTENNKLIAKFMQPSFNGVGLYNQDGVHFPIEELEFHISWDWLMPVVQKIESLGYTFTIAGVMAKVTKVLDIENSIVSLVLGDKSQKLRLVYETVVELIKWYNQQNS